MFGIAIFLRCLLSELCWFSRTTPQDNERQQKAYVKTHIWKVGWG